MNTDLVRSLVYAVEYLLHYDEGHPAVRSLLDEMKDQLDAPTPPTPEVP